jgi:hypothetical protein
MTETPNPNFVVFDGARLIARGSRADAAVAVWRAERAERDMDGGPILAFEADGRAIDFDTRGDEAEVAARHAEPRPEPRGRGRPKLGVVAREVTLLPRHWDWLAKQPGGASVALRKLVEQARGAEPDHRRMARDAAYRFASAMAGNLAAFEAAMRALYADDVDQVRALSQDWPADVREHMLSLLEA